MVKISPGNTKLGKIPNTSVVPIKDCKKGVLCSKKCYAMKAWRQYPATRAAWEHNSSAWRRRPKAAANSVIAWVFKHKPKYFRIHVGGDFINQRHLTEWEHIAMACPGTMFRSFTKRFDYDYSHLPKNLIIGFSAWPGEKLPPRKKGIKGTAYVQDGTETRIPKGTFKCPGSCDNCKVCWNSSRDIWFEQH